MIGFNGTYLKAATHHGMRITAATLGGQWVMGGWLKTATQQAILAAFGAEEGMVVISKTNDYLNAIAATDTQRAQQLADFIQEDPLLVCSLVETSKTRWLVGDGKAYVDTGVKSSANTIFEMQIQYLEVVSSSQFNGVFASDHRMQLGSTRQGFGIGYGSLHITVGENNPNITHTAMIDGKQKKGFYNGEEVSFASASFNANKSFNLYLFARWSGDSNVVDAFCKERVAYSKIEDDNVKLHLAPFTRNGTCGMLDIISGTFHPNANTQGAFTIQITDKA